MFLVISNLWKTLSRLPDVTLFPYFERLIFCYARLATKTQKYWTIRIIANDESPPLTVTFVMEVPEVRSQILKMFSIGGLAADEDVP